MVVGFKNNISGVYSTGTLDDSFTLTKDLEIHDNFSEMGAYIVVLGNKQFLSKIFKLKAKTQKEELEKNLRSPKLTSRLSVRWVIFK